MPNVLDIYRRYGVHYQTEGDTHTTQGWANTPCPFCTGSPGLHLGVNLEGVYWRCWRCGWHDPVKALSALCHVGRGEAIELYRSISPGAGTRLRERDEVAQKKVTFSPYRRPSYVKRMTYSHRTYLERRGFDPDYLESEWGVMGTGPVSSLDGIDYKHRLFVPILWDGREVSFQTRDVTGKSDLKYKACLQEREVVNHKTVLYAHPMCFNHRVCIAVEGVTDVWRLGPQAFSVFGTQYKIEQVLAASARCRSVAVVFDAERPAQTQARKLAAQLRAVGTIAWVYKLPTGLDPGALSPDEAQELVQQIERTAESVG